VFDQELDYFVTPLALDVKIKAGSGSGWTFGEVIGSTLWTSTTTSGSAAIPAVFVASRTSQGPDPGRRGGGSMLFIHLTPTGHNAADGKVADLELTYRLPGSSENVTQRITLAYPNDPAETPSETYLSAPEMAERYAMYNVFLGLRFATQSYDFNCAVAALSAIRSNATTWNTTHEDPDITADISLLDMYIANLRAHGATQSEPTLATCNAENPYGDDAIGPDYESGHDHQYACSAGGNPRGLLVIALAGVFAVRRRRRRLTRR
jgi:MYXO-CTERM domain-containing protein